MTKVVIVEDTQVRVRLVGPTGVEHRRLANRVMSDALAQARLSFEDISYVVATGYGRINVPFADRQMTEISCHAKGVASLFPSVRTALDMGGQDAKGLKIVNGELVEFVMNDKCAAGTGRYLEVLADTLGVRLEDLGGISAGSNNRIKVSNTCTIFAQTEVVTRLSEGVHVEDIVAGVHDAMASRAVNMLRRLKVEPEVVFTGGVAKNVGVVKAVSEHLGMCVRVPEDPLLTGAIGAALIGRDILLKALAKGTPIQRKDRRLEEASFFSR